MRLTLRTLLAYMDDILEPADQEELGRKIESSPFATELIHRSRDAVRRLRLSAPDVLAGGDDDIHGGDHTLDANTAAEYLDNTLSPEAVAEFERSCLEAGPNADMLLAEVSSCHHILTMVLGEPAEVDADLRQRMYALEQSPAAAKQLRIEPAHQAPQPQPAAAVAAAPAIVARTPHVEADEAGVPDYILAAAREQRRTRRRIMAVAAVAILSGIATWMLWPEEEVKVAQDVQVDNPISESTTAATTGEVVTPGGADSAAPPFVPTTQADDAQAAASAAVEPQPAPPALNPAAPSTGTEAAATAATTTAPTEGPTAPAPPVEAGPEAAAATATAEPPPPVGESTGAAPAEAGPPMVEAAATTSPPTAATSDPGVTAATATLPETPSAPTPPADDPAATPVAPPDTTATVADSATPPGDGAPAADTGAGLPTPPQPKPIGAYLGNNDLLVRLDSAAQAWIRLPPRSSFLGGERLLSLPTFRTHLVLADINVYLAGGAEVDLIKPAAGSSAELALHIPFGRVILNSGLNGNQIELSLVDETRLVRLAPSSSLAVQVRRVFEPGGDKREPAPAEVTWFLTSGNAEWGDGITAEAPATWTTVGGEDSAPAAIDELPDWVDREPITDIERRARDTVAESLSPGEPVNVGLLELSDPAGRGRRTEVRALAARSGAYVGQFDSLVRALNDVNQRASWKTHIEALRQAIARDPAAIEGIREAFAIERGQEAANDLVEMLLGFDRAAVGTTREEVQQGALVRLLRWMDDDDLTYRILASYNVNEITGTRELGGYQPQHAKSQRARSLRHYWDRLEEGELMPREPEAAAATRP